MKVEKERVETVTKTATVVYCDWCGQEADDPCIMVLTPKLAVRDRSARDGGGYKTHIVRPETSRVVSGGGMVEVEMHAEASLDVCELCASVLFEDSE